MCAAPPPDCRGAVRPVDRFSYWVRTATLVGELLAPGDGSDDLQFIDARDLARFTRTVSEGALRGAFNLAGPRLTWAEFMALLGVRDAIWVPAEILKAQGLTESELPLYRPAGGPRSSLMHVSNARAVRASLTLADPSVTARDVRHWLQSQNLQQALSPEREAALIRISRIR